MFTVKVKGWGNIFIQSDYVHSYMLYGEYSLSYIHCILIVTCLYNIILYVPLNLNPRIT